MSPIDSMYIDLHNVGTPRKKINIFWHCINGDELVSKVFWLWFVLGQGALLGVCLGILIITLMIGFYFDSEILFGFLSPFILGIATCIIIIVCFFLFNFVSLWRCAYNCKKSNLGHAVRFLVLVYISIISMGAFNLISNWPFDG